MQSVNIQVLKNKNDDLIPQTLPWSMSIKHTELVANAGEGWESNWAAKIQHRLGPHFNSKVRRFWDSGSAASPKDIGCATSLNP